MEASELNRFDRIAPYYDILTGLMFGKAILRAQKEYLHLIPEGATVLVMGGGSGAWLNQFLKKNPTARVYFVEASGKMLDLAIIKCEFKDRIKFIHGVEKDIPPVEFDAIVTNFFIDMYNEQQLKNWIIKVQGFLRRNGIWLISDFVDVKFWHKPFLDFMYWFFRTMRAVDVGLLPRWNKIVTSNGFQIIDENSFYGKFICSRAYIFQTHTSNAV